MRIFAKYLQEVKYLNVKVSGSTSSMYTIKINNTTISNSWMLETRCGFHVCFGMQDLQKCEEVKYGKLTLIMKNRHYCPVIRIGIHELAFDTGVRACFLDCWYSFDMNRNIISFHPLFR